VLVVMGECHSIKFSQTLQSILEYQMFNKQMVDKYLELREDVLGSEEFMTTC